MSIKSCKLSSHLTWLTYDISKSTGRYDQIMLVKKAYIFRTLHGKILPATSVSSDIERLVALNFNGLFIFRHPSKFIKEKSVTCELVNSLCREDGKFMGRWKFLLFVSPNISFDCVCWSFWNIKIKNLPLWKLAVVTTTNRFTVDQRILAKQVTITNHNDSPTLQLRNKLTCMYREKSLQLP